MTERSTSPYFRGWFVNSVVIDGTELALMVWNATRTSLVRMTMAQAIGEADRLDKTAAGDELRDALRVATEWIRRGRGYSDDQRN